MIELNSSQNINAANNMQPSSINPQNIEDQK